MKRVSLFFVALLTLFIQSCSNDLETGLDNSDNHLKSNYVMNQEIAVVNEGKTLRFKDQETFDRVREKLMFASDKERLAFADSLGFRSLFKIMNEADKELESMTEQCSSQEEFLSFYKDYKNKYSTLFTFNLPESEELFPYLLLEDPVQAYYTGAGKNVFIGNKEVVNKYMPSVAVYTRATVYQNIPVNDHGVKHDKRKVGLHMSGAYTKDNLHEFQIPRKFVYANFTAQKKNIFGWVRYSTIYNAIFDLGNFTVRAINKQGFAQDYPLSGAFYVNTDKTDRFRVVIGEQSGNYTVCLGYGNGIGNVKFWSRGVPEQYAGFMNINVSFPIVN